MRSKLVQIGNSHGIRIPKALIEEFHLRGEVELDIQPEGLLIRASKTSRSHWADAFQIMAKNKDDALLDKNPNTSKWDRDEWEW